MATTNIVSELKRGDMVQATRDISAAGVTKGTIGVVFEETDAYGDAGGPMVRWFTGTCCNVYDHNVMRLKPSSIAIG